MKYECKGAKMEKKDDELRPTFKHKFEPVNEVDADLPKIKVQTKGDDNKLYDKGQKFQLDELLERLKQVPSQTTLGGGD